jgi:hypothetical protein
MESNEAVVNFKAIENDLKQGLINAESNANEAGIQPQNAPIPGPRLNAGVPVVKFVCMFKNRIQFGMVTKGLPENIKDKLRHFGEVEEPEVTVYKTALDQYGTELLPPDLVELINKYSNSSLAPLVEWEIGKFKRMQAEIKTLLKDQEEEKK